MNSHRLKIDSLSPGVRSAFSRLRSCTKLGHVL
jgi:hypothetical protein